MSAIALIVELEIAPGQKERFLVRARRHRDNVLREEPGCERFDLLTPSEGGDVVFLYEVYADEPALKAHFDTPHMREYLDDTGPMITSRKRTQCNLANG